MKKKMLSIHIKVETTDSPRPSIFYLCGKRIFDVFCGTFGIILVVVTSILLLPFCLFGRNKGPLFFKQTRIGLNGKKFEIYKFRSMVVNAEEVLRRSSSLYDKYVENNYKLPSGEDPRITRLGAFLRRTSFDELPQFINILKGDMSMIGPRPVVEDELSEYGDRADDLLCAKPGAMGLWQASGRSNVGYPERAYLELQYVNNRSFHNDIIILFKNIVAICKKDGAF